MNISTLVTCAIGILLLGNIVILSMQYYEDDRATIAELLAKIEKQTNIPTPTPAPPTPAPALSSGKYDIASRNVFFDLGANRGDTAEQVTGITRTSELMSLETVYQLGKLRSGPWDLRMYEAHPGFDKQLLETREKIMKLDPAEYGGPYRVYLNNQTAIGTHYGTATFHLDVNSGPVWGSSLLDTHPDTINKEKARNVTVPMHDLVAEIINNYKIEDHVVVKMDVEGIELELVMDILTRGALPYIDEIYIEFHGFVDQEMVKCLKQSILPYAASKGYIKFGPWA